MYPRPFTRLRPDQRPTAADWNALVDYLSQREQAAGTSRGNVGAAFGAGGLQLLDGTTPGHWAKITGTSAGYKYSHVMVAPNADGTFTDLPQTADYSFGSPTDLPAVEVTQDDSVPTDGSAIVWLRPDPTIPGYRFTAPATRSKLKGVLDGSLAYQGSATLSVWAFNGTSEADTGENVTVYDWLLSSGQSIASGKNVTAFWDAASSRWYVDGSQCP